MGWYLTLRVIGKCTVSGGGMWYLMSTLQSGGLQPPPPPSFFVALRPLPPFQFCTTCFTWCCTYLHNKKGGESLHNLGSKITSYAVATKSVNYLLCFVALIGLSGGAHAIKHVRDSIKHNRRQVWVVIECGCGRVGVALEHGLFFLLTHCIPDIHLTLGR